MTQHRLVNMGAGWRCDGCGRAWDQDEIGDAEEACDGGVIPAQVGGSHYATLAVQPVEFAMKNQWDFCAASILKYLTRWRAKNGVEDLRKARHFVEIRETWRHLVRLPRPILMPMYEYVGLNHIRPDDAALLNALDDYVNAAGGASHRMALVLIEDISAAIARMS